MVAYKINEEYQGKLDGIGLRERYIAISIEGREEVYVVSISSECILQKITTAGALESLLEHISLPPENSKMKEIGLGPHEFRNVSGREGQRLGIKTGNARGHYRPKKPINVR